MSYNIYEYVFTLGNVRGVDFDNSYRGEDKLGEGG